MKFPRPFQGRLEGFWLAQLLGVLLLGLSFALIAGDSQSMLFSDQVMDAMFSGPIWGTTLARNLMWFALSLVLLHVLYATGCWLVGRLSAQAWPAGKVTLRQHVTAWFLALTIGLLANNAATYPESSLGIPYAQSMGATFLGIRLGRAILLVMLLCVAVTVAMAIARRWKTGGRPAWRTFATLGALGAVYVAITAQTIHRAGKLEPSDKPNVILIGLDSLRADLLDKQVSPGVTPHLDDFMKQGVSFTNAITPLARTFPAMIAMLSGRHPHKTGAVMNLLPRDLIREGDSLPRILGRAGYRTIYATDEVRFSNIDATYGFDQTIMPPIGASEFLIARLADTPVSNLVMNTSLTRWLFPQVYSNRGAARNYDPDLFVQRLDRELDVRQPAFLTIHLTLGHWPYSWAGSPPKTRDPEALWPDYYLQAARRVDQQFADVVSMLERRGLLENAIVVVYSDHGESFEAPHESLVPDGDPLIEALRLKPSWGHGTTVLTAHQYRIVLGMRRYGRDHARWPAGRAVAAPVSFEDIAPTMVEALSAPTVAHFDGQSLLPVLEQRAGAEHSFDGRIRFTETEYMPKGLASQGGSVSTSSLYEALLTYRIDPVTDRIEVKRSRLGSLLIDRQYAALGNTQLLAAMPRRESPGHDFLVVPLKGGQPRQLAQEPGVDEAELHALWAALHTEFGDVIKDRRQPVATSAVANR